MSTMTPSLHAVPPPTRAPVIESAVLGTVIFIVTEVMLFAGFISALVIVKANHLGPWPPPDQPRLPIEATAFNTAVLLASGVVLYFAGRAYKRQPVSARKPFAIAIGLGAFFVVFQGVEWVRLIGEGLTMTSSNLGGFFYLIVGMHALHAFAAIVVLCRMWVRLSHLKLAPGSFQAAQIFWFFVVGLWPILYVQVYL
jgi:heme/copper-type cytochrome/quinol oxidase subunit 3